MRAIIRSLAEYGKELSEPGPRRKHICDERRKTFGRSKHKVDLDAYREGLKVTGNAKAGVRLNGGTPSAI